MYRLRASTIRPPSVSHALAEPVCCLGGWKRGGAVRKLQAERTRVGPAFRVSVLKHCLFRSLCHYLCIRQPLRSATAGRHSPRCQPARRPRLRLPLRRRTLIPRRSPRRRARTVTAKETRRPMPIDSGGRRRRHGRHAGGVGCWSVGRRPSLRERQATTSRRRDEGSEARRRLLLEPNLLFLFAPFSKAASLPRRFRASTVAFRHVSPPRAWVPAGAPPRVTPPRSGGGDSPLPHMHGSFVPVPLRPGGAPARAARATATGSLLMRALRRRQAQVCWDDALGAHNGGKWAPPIE